jgi:hypothetical protein
MTSEQQQMYTVYIYIITQISHSWILKRHTCVEYDWRGKRFPFSKESIQYMAMLAQHLQGPRQVISDGPVALYLQLPDHGWNPQPIEPKAQLSRVQAPRESTAPNGLKQPTCS